MRVRKVVIKNYKSLKSVEMMDIGNLVVLIGENGSGKSNLLEALDLFFRNYTTSGSHTENLSDYYWYRKDAKPPIVFDMELELDESELSEALGPSLYESITQKRRTEMGRFRVSRSLVRNGSWNTQVIELGNIKLLDGKSTLALPDLIVELGIKIPCVLVELEVKRKDGGPETKHMVLVGRERKAYWAGNDLWKLAGTNLVQVEKIITDDPASFAKQVGVVLENREANLSILGFSSTEQILARIESMIRQALRIIFPPSPAFGTQTQRLLLEPTVTQEIKKLALAKDYDGEEEWKSLSSDFESANRDRLRLMTKGDELLAEEGGRTYPIESLGGGHQSWFRLIKNLRSGFSVYCIEEPEAHMHPGLARTLFAYLKDTAKHSQLFITTHSPIFIDREDKTSNWLVEFDGASSHIYRLDDFKQALTAIGARPSDRFVPDAILLVEGESDRAFFEGCARKLKVSTDGLVIVPIHGKGNARRSLDAWLPVVRGAMIRLCILLDHDAKCAVLEMVRRGVIEEGDYVLLDSEVEDLYPVEMIRKAFSEMFETNIDPMDPLSPPRKDHLESILDSKATADWSIKLAESIANGIPKDEIPKPIAEMLKSLKT